MKISKIKNLYKCFDGNHDFLDVTWIIYAKVRKFNLIQFYCFVKNNYQRTGSIWLRGWGLVGLILWWEKNGRTMWLISHCTS